MQTTIHNFLNAEKKRSSALTQKFGEDLKVKYYDGVPTTEKEFEESINFDEEVEE